MAIKVETPTVNTENIIKAKAIKEEEGVDIFNSESPLFSDICIPYTDENGNDIILTDRKKDLFQNIKICSMDALININYSTYKVICQCSLNKAEKSFTLNDKKYLLN